MVGVCVAEELQCRTDEVDVLAAQVRVSEAQELNLRTELDQSRDHLVTVTQQLSRARQQVAQLEVSTTVRL